MLARGDERGAPVAYRFFDESGELLAMRSDMTVPIARLVANRYARSEPPFRLCYLARAYRAIRPQRGQMREFTQAGVELVGLPAPEGTVEVIEVLAAALDAAGLRRAVIGLGDADLYRQLLAELAIEGEPRARILDCLATHDHVGLEAEVAALDIGETERETLIRLPTLRGGPEVLDLARGLGGDATERATRRLSETYAALRERGVADRVNVDLGLLRDLGYYTGRDPRGLRPGARAHPRRRRALRRAHGPLWPPVARRRLRPAHGAAARRPGRGGGARMRRAIGRDAVDGTRDPAPMGG